MITDPGRQIAADGQTQLLGEIPPGDALDESIEVERIQVGSTAGRQTAAVVGQPATERAASGELPLPALVGDPVGELQLNDPDVVVVARIQITDVVNPHPPKAHSMAAGWAEGQVGPPRPFERCGGTIASFDLESIEGLGQVRRPEHHRVLSAEEEVDVLDVVIHSPPGAPAEHRNVLLEPAEIVITAADAQGDSTGFVVPHGGLNAHGEPLSPGPGGEVRMEVEIGAWWWEQG